MLVKPLPDSEEDGHENQEAHQKYEAMQCFAVSQPKSIKEEGEGKMDPGIALVITGWCSHRGKREAVPWFCPMFTTCVV